LPVEGSILFPSLVHKFKPEFERQLSDPRQNPEPFQVPLISDFDEQAHRFIYDDRFAFKNPDWTYSIAAVMEAPAPPWRHFYFNHEIDELKQVTIGSRKTGPQKRY
jgi:hypothetical protein